ncbi:Nitrilase family, member 2 [Seminavis robusta]|uniref:Nitrilase family, member 2 n=1 Tax=Seminavis robusta TaxID=568900 RepID=A0A9N8ESX8_9STRA|nr:Nitrilase family, member 2 [Seminavis robusta]|eukprot:Sro1594_g284580.1 Nitrilase family, member 2 (267) ;mRNA; r:3914-4714
MVFSDSINLPDSFVPPQNVAVLGRGKRYLKHPGNRRLRELVQSEIPNYLSSPNRKDKSGIILRVIEIMRKGTAGQVGFVRYDTISGKWFLVDDGTARVSVAQIFRDALSKHYRSSRQHKQKKRQAIKEQKSMSPPSPSTGPANDHQAKECTAVTTKGSMSQSMSLSSLIFQTPGVSSTAGMSKMPGRCTQVLQKALRDSRELLSTVEDSTENQAVFDSLFDAFADSVNTDSNPYEPTPIASQVIPQQQPRQSSFHFGDVFQANILV